MVNSPLIRPYFLGETWHRGGVPLDSHDIFSKGIPGSLCQPFIRNWFSARRGRPHSRYCSVQNFGELPHPFWLWENMCFFSWTTTFWKFFSVKQTWLLHNSLTDSGFTPWNTCPTPFFGFVRWVGVRTTTFSSEVPDRPREFEQQHGSGQFITPGMFMNLPKPLLTQWKRIRTCRHGIATILGSV